jgi:hypothetical protein
MKVSWRLTLVNTEMRVSITLKVPVLWILHYSALHPDYNQSPLINDRRHSINFMNRLIFSITVMEDIIT